MLEHLHSIVSLLPRNNGYFQQSNGTTVAWQHVCVLCKASQSHLNQKCRMKKKSIFICFVMCVCSMVVCTTVCSFPSHYNCLIGETNNFLHLSKNHEFYWATAAAMRGWRSKLNIRIQSTCRRWTISVFFFISILVWDIKRNCVASVFMRKKETVPAWMRYAPIYCPTQHHPHFPRTAVALQSHRLKLVVYTKKLSNRCSGRWMRGCAACLLPVNGIVDICLCCLNEKRTVVRGF